MFQHQSSGSNHAHQVELHRFFAGRDLQGHAVPEVGLRNEHQANKTSPFQDKKLHIVDPRQSKTLGGVESVMIIANRVFLVAVKALVVGSAQW